MDKHHEKIKRLHDTKNEIRARKTMEGQPFILHDLKSGPSSVVGLKDSFRRTIADKRRCEQNMVF